MFRRFVTITGIPCAAACYYYGTAGGLSSSSSLLIDTAHAEAALPNPKVYLDITIGGKDAGRMTFELYADVVPKTAENFRALCVGATESKGYFKGGNTLQYKGSIFHVIVPGYMCQGGALQRADGALHGESIYGGYFTSESFKGKAGKHTGFGCLSMANAGPNTNGSQFFICTADTPWLDGKHVVFGRMVEGEKTLRMMEAEGSRNGQPKNVVCISECGELPQK